MEDAWDMVFGPRKKRKEKGTRRGTGKRGKKKVKRKAVSATLNREIAVRSGGSCEYCGATFSGSFLDPRKIGSKLHHIDRNPSNNKKSNLILLCPTHHDMADSGEIPKSELRNRISTLGFGLRL
ncbi:MAG: HNH endonuclease [Euryarchaeota archaeon]|nr:HNH endonuclease [Euryarchaeota archaeon]